MVREHSLTVAAQLVEHVLDGVRRARLDPAKLLGDAGIEPAALRDPACRISLESYLRLVRVCQLALEDETYGLLGRQTRIGTFRMVCLLAINGGTLQGALNRMVEFGEVVDHSFRQELRVKGRQAMLVVRRRPEARVVNPLPIASALMVPHRLMGWLVNERVILDLVQLDHPPPPYSAEYRHMFYRAPVVFGQDVNAIHFDARYLRRRIVQTESSMQGYLRRAPMDLYLPLDAGGKVTLAVRAHLHRTLGAQRKPAELDQVAQVLRLHPQALRRQLAQEGTSFRAIKAQVRRDQAIHQLGHSELSVEEVAEKVGYTETSTFIRAFKQWTGRTPQQFRRGT